MIISNLYKKYYPIGKHSIIHEKDNEKLSKLQSRFYKKICVMETEYFFHNVKVGAFSSLLFYEHLVECRKIMDSLYIPLYEPLIISDSTYNDKNRDINALNFLLLWNKYNISFMNFRMFLYRNMYKYIFWSEKPAKAFYVPAMKKRKLHFLKMNLSKIPDEVASSIRDAFSKLIYIAADAEINSEIRDFYIRQTWKIEYIVDQIQEEIKICLKSEDRDNGFFNMNANMHIVKEFLDRIYEEYEKIKKVSTERNRDIEVAMNELSSYEDEKLQRNSCDTPFFEVACFTEAERGDETGWN